MAEHLTYQRSRLAPDIEVGVEPIEALFTRASLAKYLQVSERQVDNYIADGNIAVVRLGKSVRFRRTDVERFLDRHTRNVHRHARSSGGPRGAGVESL